MLSIWKRELQGYFYTPVGYVFMGVFLTLSSVIFFLTIMQSRSSDLLTFIGTMSYLWMLLCPVLTMRLLAEEKQKRTDQLLLTSPVSLGGLVLGKFFAAVAMYAIAVSITVVYSIILAGFASLEWMVVIGNIFGALLFGAALISIGLFISSMTENQMIAAVGTFAVMMFIMMMDSVSSILPASFAFIGELLAKLSFLARYDELVTGVLDISTILFFISVAAVFNFLTVRVLEKKRWD